VKAIKIEPGIQPVLIDIKDDGTGDSIRAHVGQMLQVVPTHTWPGLTFWCDEEGKLAGKPVNPFATGLVNDLPYDFLVGTVVITGDRGGQTVDVPQEAIDAMVPGGIDGVVARLRAFTYAWAHHQGESRGHLNLMPPEAERLAVDIGTAVAFIDMTTQAIGGLLDEWVALVGSARVVDEVGK